ncbi:MAG: tRNA pseudouridine(55) synthase TruB [Actinomycetota bacterium]|nr:tRNA pseudouridine(55) synthase TruB [Actinomycetota bacterium]
MTSARAVAQVKRLLPKRTKIGHTGTLDPLASGLLVLLIGRATRLSRYVTGLDKTYTATARFGAVSDTLDAEGEITPLHTPPPDEEAIRGALTAFTGDILQIPPMASALKHSGVRLYDLHRRGLTVEREPRPVKVHALVLSATDRDAGTATFEISCSSGTYVRTLIHDLAASLDSGAYLTALRRHSVGHLTLQAAEINLDANTIYNRIIHPTEVVSHLPRVEVPAGVGRVGVCNGRRLGRLGVEGGCRVMCEGELLAVYRDEGDWARAEVVLCAG